MKAVILNGESKSSSLKKFEKIVRNLLKTNNFKVHTISLKKIDIASCRGCFSCWIRDPGICFREDGMNTILKKVIKADLLIILTPVIFGGYSYHLKKALDRMIPLISPFFMLVDGEIHHKPRYAHYPSLLGIGILSENDKNKRQIFNNLVRRNSINLHSPFSDSAVFVQDDNDKTIEMKVAKIINNMRNNYERK